MDPKELRFEYCALRYLLQWEQRERTLREQMTRNPNLQQLRSALGHFQVARTFPRLGNDRTAQAVLDALHEVDRESRLSPQKKVEELARRFQKMFKRYNLSAASKLLWLKRQEHYIIYDKQAVKALRDLGSIFEDANYEQYCSCWRKQYRLREEAIRKAASRLRDVLAFFTHWHRSGEQLGSLAAKPWFRERVFDIYLWEIGSAGQRIAAELGE